MNAAALKALNEKIGQKTKEARAVLELPTTEKRDIKPEELQKFDGIHKELEGLKVQQDAEYRQLALETQRAPELSATETRDIDNKFSLGKMLRESSGRTGRALSGLELELADEGANEAKDAGIPNDWEGVMLPRFLVRRQDIRQAQRSMTATGQTSVTGDQGGMTVQTTPQGLLDAFYNKQVLGQMGITRYDGLIGNLDLPRWVRPSAPVEKSETAAATAMSPLTAKLSLVPSRLPAYIDVSTQLLLQSNVNIQQAINNSIIEELASVMQISLLHGSGSSNVPTGVANTSGIGAVYAGGATSNSTNPNGAAVVWADMINLESSVAIANADIGKLGYLVNARTRGAMKSTQRGGGTSPDSMMIWDDRAGGLVNSYAPYCTNSVSSTLTKGGSSTLSAGFFGNWADLVQAVWGGLNLQVVTDGTLATTGLLRIVGSIYYSGGVQRPASFSAILDWTK